MSKIPSPLLHIHKSHPHPTSNSLHVHACQNKWVNSHQTRITDHMKQFKSDPYLTYIRDDLF
jgi:hypothetical protein